MKNQFYCSSSFTILLTTLYWVVKSAFTRSLQNMPKYNVQIWQPYLSGILPKCPMARKTTSMVSKLQTVLYEKKPKAKGCVLRKKLRLWSCYTSISQVIKGKRIRSDDSHKGITTKSMWKLKGGDFCSK